MLLVALDGFLPDHVPFIWIIAGMGVVWTILATVFVRARARAWKSNQSVRLRTGSSN